MAKSKGQVEEISARLSQTFQELVPLHPSEKGRKRPSQKELVDTTATALTKFYRAAHAERIKHNLGIIRRARVAIAVQQQLIHAGYPPKLVKQVLFAMLTAAFAAKAD